MKKGKFLKSGLTHFWGIMHFQFSRVRFLQMDKNFVLGVFEGKKTETKLQIHKILVMLVYSTMATPGLGSMPQLSAPFTFFGYGCNMTAKALLIAF